MTFLVRQRMSSARRILGVVCLCYFHSVLAECSDADALIKLHQEARQIKSPTIAGLGALFIAATNAPNSVVRDAAIRACGAGILALGERGIYSAMVRPLLGDKRQAFENSCIIECDFCSGEGGFEEHCEKCLNRVEFGRNNCKRCNGKGVFWKVCKKCSGKGKILTWNILQIYQDELSCVLKAGDELLANQKKSARQQVEQQADLKKQDSLNQIVDSFMVAAQKQIAKSSILSSHLLATNDFNSIMSQDYTTAERNEAFNRAFERGFPSQKNPSNWRYLFLPIPAGLVYNVIDVDAGNRGTDWTLSLDDVKNCSRNEACREISIKLAGTVYGAYYLAYLHVYVPPWDEGAKHLKKKQLITSTAWIIPIKLYMQANGWPCTEFQKYCFRSEQELKEMAWTL